MRRISAWYKLDFWRIFISCRISNFGQKDLNMAKRSVKVQVSETGRLSLPADMRREMGLEKGGVVTLDMVDGRLQILSMKQVVDRVRHLARESGLTKKASVDDFLNWKREEAQREGAIPKPS
jgi:bifunctional DNA-binding transcriptional regulator/antitoxin component of YhaV-PrlF toxin-antitoxin module